MLTPLTDAYHDPIVFGFPRKRALQHMVAGLACLTTAMVLYRFVQVGFAPRWILSLAFVIAAVYLLLVSAYRSTVEVDISKRRLTTERGFFFRLKKVVSEIPVLGAETVLKRFDPEEDDQANDPLFSMSLVFDSCEIPLITATSDESVGDTGRVLAHRLATGFREDLVARRVPLGRRPIPGAEVLVWAGLAGAIICIVWPFAIGRAQIGNRGMLKKGILAPPMLNASPDRPLTLFERANRLYENRQFQESENILKQAIESGQDKARCLNLLAYVYSQYKRFPDALATAKLATAEAPNDSGIIDTVGEMLELNGNYISAVKYYKRALTMMSRSESIETHMKLGRTFVHLKRPADAIPHLQFSARFPTEPWHSMSIKLLTQLGVTPDPLRRPRMAAPVD